MKVLFVERETPERFLLWILDGDYYKKIILRDDETLEVLTTELASDYRNYNYFVTIMGKLDPNDVFLAKPVKVPSLNFEVIREITREYKGARRLRKRGRSSKQKANYLKSRS